MSENTKIQWCDDTWNYWRGCRKVAPECDNCYIVTTVPFRVTGQKHGKERVLSGSGSRNSPLGWNKKPWVCDGCGRARADRQSDCEWCSIPDPNTGFKSPDCHRRRVFSLSLGDWLDNEVPIEWLAEMLRIVFECQNINFLLLTKRPQNFGDRIADAIGSASRGHAQSNFASWLTGWRTPLYPAMIPRNVWVGASVGCDISELIKIPAHTRFISVEPMLHNQDMDLVLKTGKVHWIIFGGESGQNARTLDVDWIRSGLQQCQEAKIPAFVKQLGANVMGREMDKWVCRMRDKKGGDIAEWPEELRVREWPEVTR